MHLPIFPKRIEIELVSACNLRCTYCPRHYVNNLNGFMDYDLFERLIDEITPFPETILVLHRRGESLLHPRFVDMMNIVKNKFKEVQLATNATVLNGEKAQAIIDAVTFLSFSIDTPQSYETKRPPAKYEKVRHDIEKFLRANSRQGNPVRTQVSMVKTNGVSDQEIIEFENIWTDKVDRIRIYEEHTVDGNFGSLKLKRRKRKPCVMPFYEMLIYCDGKTGRCNHDWDGAPIGDILGKKISTIWQNGVYKTLRNQHEYLSITDPVCSACDSWYPEEGHQGTGKVVEN